MNKVCEMCEKGKKYTTPNTKKLCFDCWKQLDGISCMIIDVYDDNVYVGRWCEVWSMENK